MRVPPPEEAPFDLSRNTSRSSPGPHMSPAGRPNEQQGDEQPLDLRVEHKKLSLMIMRRQVSNFFRSMLLSKETIQLSVEKNTIYWHVLCTQRKKG